MPYIVTTKRPKVVVHARRNTVWEHSHRAVVTLDKARDLVAAIGSKTYTSELRDPAIFRPLTLISESGGTIGPLPDGTEIEVEPRATHAIARMSDDPGLLAEALSAGDYPPASLTADVCAAFNAREDAH